MRMCMNINRNERLNRIEKIFWETTKLIPSHIVKNMSNSEGKYIAKYKDLIEEYTKSLPYTKFDLAKVSEFTGTLSLLKSYLLKSECLKTAVKYICQKLVNF